MRTTRNNFATIGNLKGLKDGYAIYEQHSFMAVYATGDLKTPLGFGSMKEGLLEIKSGKEEVIATINPALLEGKATDYALNLIVKSINQ